ncbi:YjcZ family sporulation protein [Bacillus sp. AC79A.1]
MWKWLWLCGGFALLIVLFILLIIVGASWCGYGGF